MNDMKIFSIGKIMNNDETVCIKLEGKYSEGLKGLYGFSHIQVLWWADKCDNASDRSTLTEKKPYKKGPEEIGVFATHSPERPNPVAISNVKIASVNVTEGLSAMTRFCFENTELKRLWTQVDIRNIASCRMLEKCGFTKEGMIRQGKMVNTWCDYYIYGILASDI